MFLFFVFCTCFRDIWVLTDTHIYINIYLYTHSGLKYSLEQEKYLPFVNYIKCLYSQNIIVYLHETAPELVSKVAVDEEVDGCIHDSEEMRQRRQSATEE